MTRTQKALVGLFVATGLVLFSAGLFLIGDRRLLFEPQFPLETRFGRVTGLEVGTVVRVAGLDAGEVLDIGLPAGPSERFRVTMRLREDLRPLVRRDSVAAIQTDGIVGSTFIQIGRGSDAAPMVEPGDTIEGMDPIAFADLIEEGRDTFRTVTSQFTTLSGELSDTMSSFGDTTRRASELFLNIGDDLEEITQASAQITDEAGGLITDARAILQQVNSGQGTVGRLLTDDTVYQRLVSLTEEAQRTVTNLREATDRARAMIDNVSSSSGPAQQVVEGLRDTLAQTREVMSDLSDSTEALKRNFLFRGFFQDRGFFDLDAVSRDAYLSGVLAGDKRTVLRVWLDGALLFAPDPSGLEQLTEDGRRRIDLAMGDLIQYPGDSPLVVEGYALGADALLVSSDRAALVRDYLVRRFRRNATVTGTMPLADQSLGSPNGDGQWSGVALALFVEEVSLRERR